MDKMGFSRVRRAPFKTSDTNHIAYCGAGGVIIEMLDLWSVEPEDYLLAALPVELKGLVAAPSRVLLMNGEDLA